MSEGNNFSNESQNIDYTSLEGIRTRTGVDNDKSFGTCLYIKKNYRRRLNFLSFFHIINTCLIINLKFLIKLITTLPHILFVYT